MKVHMCVFILFICLIVFGQCGCQQYFNGNYSQDEITRKSGIIEQCKTVNDYDIPKEEKEKRINDYLIFNVKNGDISEKEKTLIEICLKRK